MEEVSHINFSQTCQKKVLLTTVISFTLIKLESESPAKQLLKFYVYDF